MRFVSGQPDIGAVIMCSKWSGSDGDKSHGEFRMLMNMTRKMACCEGDLLVVPSLTNLSWPSNRKWVV